MSTLAFNKEGEPFSFDPRTEQLRLRRFRKPGARGTCEVVLDADGEQIYVGADADYAEVRDAVDNAPGFYRLDQCDEDGRPIPSVPAAYVSIETTRNAGSSTDGDAMAVIRELAAINAEVSKTIADRFAAVMQSTVEILRAADGAGIAHRRPLVVSAPVVNDDDEDDDDIEDEPEVPPAPPANPMISALASISTLVQVVQPMVEQMRTIYRDMKATAARTAAQATPPAGATASGPVAAAAPPSEAAPSSGPVHSGGAAGASGANDASATAPNATTARAQVSAATWSPSSAGTSSLAASATSVKNPIASSAATTAPAMASSSATTALATASSALPASSTSPGNATLAALSTQTVSQQASPNTAPRPVATQEGAAALVAASPTAIRNAPLAPTTQQLTHLMAIYARLTPKEQAIAEQVITRMTHDLRAKWLANLSAEPVEQAVRMIRDTIANLRFAQRDRERG